MLALIRMLLVLGQAVTWGQSHPLLMCPTCTQWILNIDMTYVTKADGSHMRRHSPGSDICRCACAPSIFQSWSCSCAPSITQLSPASRTCAACHSPPRPAIKLPAPPPPQNYTRSACTPTQVCFFRFYWLNARHCPPSHWGSGCAPAFSDTFRTCTPACC